MTTRPERCELSDLLIEHCGCEKHRPDLKPIEIPVERERRYYTYPLTTVVEAQFEGRCEECRERISFGEMITPQRSELADGYSGRWVHEECARDAELEASR